MLETTQLDFEIEGEFTYSIDNARQHTRHVNNVTRSVVLETCQAIWGEEANIRDYYEYFAPWLLRTAFYNFLNNRNGISTDRCLGILYSCGHLRCMNGLPPFKLTEEQLECLLTERRLNLLRVYSLEWLSSTMSVEIPSAHPHLYGIICNELNSSESLPSVIPSEKEMSVPGLDAIREQLRSLGQTSTPKHSSPELF